MATAARTPAPNDTQTSLVAGLIRLLRPRQWAKNVLVFAAPGAAGVLTESDELAQTLVAFVCFCLAASGTYFLNDAADVESDRRHPTKRFRPVADGSVPVPVARILGVVLILAGVLSGFATGSWKLPVAVAGYVTLTTCYTIWLKHIAVVDLAAVAAGFVIRALAGAAATDVEVSDWFLIVASFGSLFMVAGKRSAELQAAGKDAAGQRAVLASYTPQFLTYARVMFSTAALVGYVLWAFEEAGNLSGPPWYELSIIPFVLAILRYALRLERGEGGAPEELVFGDRTLQVLGATWAILFGLGVYW